ncbi:flagellar hook protein FlgE [Methylobacterium sp. BE186]|uniref:flagellar hook protein FlgE n=1 Tax=Methylobacterium sp. BE186 TaxID=2817715 RepID=UPI002854CB3C|nr:flagellar hook protein FlgE [Methylobacterium sp. BE186]MDR7040026.1 flagellar hook protein FlgE [Methylobacterium sp. BE186]
MSLIGVLRTGVSGMNAQSNRISTVAENIQNSGTTGYKRTSTEFSSLLLESADYGNYNSGAVETAIRRSVGEQGPIAFTNSKTDIAIQGNGFFVVQDTNKGSYLTRSGNFVVDGPTGNLVNAGGFTLMGYSLANGEPSPALNSVQDMVPINVSQIGTQARPSNAGSIAGNLPYDEPILPATPAPVPVGAAYSKKTSLVTFNNLGQAVTLDIYLAKTASDTWSVSIYDASAKPPYTLPSRPLTTSNLTFGANGKPPFGTTTTVTVPNGQPVKIDLSNVSQLAGAYALNGAANGSAPTSVTGAEFGTDGTVYAIYADGTRAAAYKVPLADVPSPDNLEPRAGNVYTMSPKSGDLLIGFAGLNGRGTIKAGALEQSNVDVSTELTAMIESQTVYTANSKVFMTGNELLETLMNLKR